MEKPIRKGIPMKKCNCQICLNILLLMGLFLFPVGAGALEPISEETDALLEEEFKWLKEEAFDVEVVTASKKVQRISEAPATIISITAEEIRAYGWRDLKDIFRALPGIDLSYNVQGELKTQVVMRGVKGNQKILILQDGHRYSPESGEPFLYSHNMPLHIYERIEIIYGPASSLYGADAYAGVINLITKAGGDVDGADVSAGYISTGAYTADLTFGKRIDDDIDVILSGRIYRGEDEDLHEDYKEYDAVNQYQGELGEMSNEYPIRNWNLFGKVKYKRFTAGFDWQRELESTAWVSLPERYAYVDDFLWGQEIRHLYVDHKTYESEELNIKTSVILGDYELNPSTNYYIVVKDEAGNLVDGYPGYKFASSSYWKARLQADWEISDKLSLIGGLSYSEVKSFPKTRNLAESFDADGSRLVDYTDFTDPNGYSFGILGYQEPFFGERESENYSAFLQAEYRFSPMIKFDAGLRYDYNSIYEETFNPRAGLILDPVDELTVKILYGTAYIQPANFYRYENFANPFLMHIPNEDIEPEELTNYALDVTWGFAENFSLHTALFYNEMENIIRPMEAPPQADGYPYYNPYRESYPEDPGYVEYNGNRGEIESMGGEITLRHRLDPFATSLSYAYVTGEDEDFDIAGISEHKITLNTSYIGRKWTGGLTLRYYSEVSTDRNNYKYGDAESGGDESYGFDGDIIAYINLIYKITEDLSATLTIDNLFDNEHYGSVPFDGSPVVVPRAPQPLRKIYAGLRYSF